MRTPTFKTTHWSLVQALAHDRHPRRDEAWEHFAKDYWYPLYAFARRSGRGPEAATDLTQGFFAELLESELVSRATPERGRFRALLLASFKNYLGMEHRAVTAQKRGGGNSVLSLDEPAAEGRYAIEPVDEASPDWLFAAKSAWHDGDTAQRGGTATESSSSSFSSSFLGAISFEDENENENEDEKFARLATISADTDRGALLE